LHDTGDRTQTDMDKQTACKKRGVSYSYILIHTNTVAFGFNHLVAVQK
jgi:hypothetical protein